MRTAPTLVTLVTSLLVAACGGDRRMSNRQGAPCDSSTASNGGATSTGSGPHPTPPPNPDPDSAAPPHFLEVSAQVGVQYHEGPPFDGQLNCAIPKYCEYNLFTGAAAVGDYDNDGFPNLYVSRLFATPLLFHNRGDNTFEDVTASAGLAIPGHRNGAAWVDIDDDGDLDLVAQGVGVTPHFLVVNQGNGTFVEDGIARGIAMADAEGKLATSVAVGDFDRDGWLDLHLAEWSMKGLPGPDPDPPFPEPTHYGHTRLFRNLGAAKPGYFEDVTLATNAIVDPPGSDGQYQRIYTFANALVDFDDDDWPDLALTGDFATSRFLWNNGGTFVEKTVDTGVGKDAFGMGAATADLDGDGRLDWYVASISGGMACVQGFFGSDDYGNHLYHYAGNRTFEDTGKEQGTYDGLWSWGVAMFDHDHDGDLDIAATNGVSYPFVPPGHMFTTDPNRFWQNDAGTFTERATELGFVDTRRGKGLVTLDYDLDGDLDVFVVNNADLPALYRNDGAHGDWLKVRVLNARGRDAVGAKVRVVVRDGESPRLGVIGAGTHFLGQSQLPAHFGLG
ncbi:MAG: CRTAC1 family protein [Deltaproteobacteria bacterium]|nr:CRTAC1 family protein [Deltaproteobacteria bacterium]